LINLKVKSITPQSCFFSSLLSLAEESCDLNQYNFVWFYNCRLAQWNYYEQYEICE